MVDIIHRIGIKAPVDQVYKTLTTIICLSNWWTNTVNGEGHVGGNIEFIFHTKEGNEIGKMVIRVIELTPAKEVHWRCVDGPAEWIGTDITFSLSEQDNQVILLFGHKNWRQAVEFTAHCSMKWAVFLLSLRDYIETGKGKPSPDDLKIDNWN